MVRSGASTNWFRAGLPTSRRPCGSRPTTEGRIGSPSSSGQDDRPAVADDGDLAVGRPQVDADDRFHGQSSAQSVSQSGSARVSASSGQSSDRRRPRSVRASSAPRPRRVAAAGPDLGVAEHPAPPGVAAPDLLDDRRPAAARGRRRPRRRSSARGRRAGPRSRSARSARPPSPGGAGPGSGRSLRAGRRSSAPARLRPVPPDDVPDLLVIATGASGGGATTAAREARRARRPAAGVGLLDEPRPAPSRSRRGRGRGPRRGRRAPRRAACPPSRPPAPPWARPPELLDRLPQRRQQRLGLLLEPRALLVWSFSSCRSAVNSSTRRYRPTSRASARPRARPRPASSASASARASRSHRRNRARRSSSSIGSRHGESASASRTSTGAGRRGAGRGGRRRSRRASRSWLDLEELGLEPPGRVAHLRRRPRGSPRTARAPGRAGTRGPAPGSAGGSPPRRRRGQAQDLVGVVHGGSPFFRFFGSASLGAGRAAEAGRRRSRRRRRHRRRNRRRSRSIAVDHASMTSSSRPRDVGPAAEAAEGQAHRAGGRGPSSIDRLSWISGTSAASSGSLDAWASSRAFSKCSRADRQVAARNGPFSISSDAGHARGSSAASGNSFRPRFDQLLEQGALLGDQAQEARRRRSGPRGDT